MPDNLVLVQRLHPEQPRPYSQVDPAWTFVAPARFFGGTGAWGHLADGSWDIVVPIQLRRNEAEILATYGAITRPATVDPRDLDRALPPA